MIFSLHFVLWLILMKHQSITKTKYWQTIFSQLFSFTLRHKLWILSKPDVFTCFVCIWSFGRAQSSKCTLLVSFRARRAGTYTRAHTHTHTHTHTSAWGTASLVRIVLSTFYYQTCPAISNCKDGILQQSTNDWSDSDVEFWSGRNECAAVKGIVVLVLEETWLKYL